MSEPLIEEVQEPQLDVIDAGETTAQPAAEAPALEPVALPELQYAYQPTDENNRPLGGKQVLKYRTQDELIAKMQEQNILLIRKLRVETRNNRLGIHEPEETVTDAQRERALVQFNQRELTPDERYQLSKDMVDPEKFDEVRDAIFESALGVKPEELRSTLMQLQDDNREYKAVRESELFMGANPTYYKCLENGQAIASWMRRHELAFVQANYQKAYDTLRKAGVMVESAAEIAEPVIVPVLEPPAIVIAPVEHPPAHIPSGLTRENAADVGVSKPVGEDLIYEVGEGPSKRVFKGLAAVNAMPADVYKHHVLHTKGFNEKVKKLEAEVAAKRAAAR